MLRRFGLSRPRALHSVTLETARSCNLRCIQCANHAKASEIRADDLLNANGLLSIETFDRVLPILEHAEALALDNHGEPLMNPNLEAIIRKAKQWAPHLHTKFTSNFMLMTAARARSLLMAGLDCIQVSVNGTTKETYETIMRGARFEKLLENLRAFADMRRSVFNCLTTFSVCMTTMRSNLEELVGLPAMVAPFGVNLIRVNCLLPFNRNARSQSLYDDHGWDERREKIHAETLAEAHKYRIGIYFPSMTSSRRTCTYPVRNLSISANGEVSPCWMLDIPPGYQYYRGGERHSLPYLSMGNVHDGGALSIWNSGKFVEFRQLFEDGRPPAFCSACPVGLNQICG
jgi:MoaA/NifB/PqqE/SkfB family radical SAM enzyme